MITAYGPSRKTQLHRQFGFLIQRSAIAMMLAGWATVGCAPLKKSVTTAHTPWRWDGGSMGDPIVGQSVRSPNYLIHTTLRDPAVVDRLVRTLEQSLTHYRSILPTAAPDPRPLECFAFETRAQWVQFTLATTGSDAALYLQMVHGGYTIGDRFVCYLGNEPDMRSIAAHEGFHQYCARRFRSRLAPAFEEGLAARFEGLALDRPREPQANHPRHVQTLVDARAANTLIPLATLVRLNAGDVVQHSPGLIYIYYAQCWSLTRFLETDPRHRASWQRFLEDHANGTIARSANSPNADPATQVEAYFGSLGALEEGYRTWIAQIRPDSNAIE